MSLFFSIRNREEPGPLIERPGEVPHHYGKDVHVFDDSLALTRLAKLGEPSTVQPETNRLVRNLYRGLIEHWMAMYLPCASETRLTRMAQYFEQLGIYKGMVINKNTEVVCVALARAGNIPSELAFELLTEVLDPHGVRLDCLGSSRVTDADGKITGSKLDGDKIGGDIEDKILLFCDPMLATGTSLINAINLYREQNRGTPRHIFTLNLVAAPEGLKRVTTETSATVIAYRVDRGLSPAHVLNSALGRYWQEELGLTKKGYIVPGLGGMGEEMTNSHV